MRYDLGDFRFDIVGYQQVKAEGGIREQFTVDLYHLGKPLSWHPNQKGADDFPGFPNRQVIEWVGYEHTLISGPADSTGKLLTDEEAKALIEKEGPEAVHDEYVGTKRGADFRTRFFPTLVNLAEKCLIAEQGGKTKGEVTDAEMQKLAFVAPVDLLAKSRDVDGKVIEERSLEEAVVELTKADVKEASSDRL